MIKSCILEKNLEECFKIRFEVFIKEQGLNPEEEIDETDNVAKHILVFKDNKAVATGRFFIVDNYWKIGRLCVLKEYRNLNLGSYILSEVEKEIKKLNGNKIYISSQYHAKNFYIKNGFEVLGDIYMEEGIEHIKMFKVI